MRQTRFQTRAGMGSKYWESVVEFIRPLQIGNGACAGGFTVIDASIGTRN